MSSPETAVWPIRKLRPSKNARTHSKKQIRKLAKSLLKFGWTAFIVTDEHGNILAGHARYEAAILNGWSHVPVIILRGLSDTQKRAIALADNRIALDAGWNRDILSQELSELKDLLPGLNLSLFDLGFEAPEIDALFGDRIDPEQDPADAEPAIFDHAVSRIGDLWDLGGKHRLYCGSALDPQSWKILFGRDLAAAIISDPPFNLRIKSPVGRGATKQREFVQGSGELSQAEFQQFLETALKLATRYSVSGSLHYLFMDWRHAFDLLLVGREIYTDLKNIVVWVKTNGGQGSFYRSQHEFIFVFKNGDAPHRNNIELGKYGRNRTNVWTYAGVNSFRVGRLDDLATHPTTKPVGLIADAMRDCTQRGDIVADPFLGSGTTILAVEKVGRRGYPDLRAAAIALAERFKPNAILIEDTSAGTSLAQELKQHGRFPVRPVTVEHDKQGRAYVQQGKFARGEVIFPQDAAFMPELLKELVMFPHGRTDDIVDSIMQALAFQKWGYDSTLSWV